MDPDVNLLVTGCFVLYSILQVFRLITGASYSHPDIRSVFYSSTLITCIAAVGTSSTLLFPHPMCIDGNGYVEILNEEIAIIVNIINII